MENFPDATEAFEGFAQIQAAEVMQRSIMQLEEASGELTPDGLVATLSTAAEDEQQEVRRHVENQTTQLRKKLRGVAHVGKLPGAAGRYDSSDDSIDIDFGVIGDEVSGNSSQDVSLDLTLGHEGYHKEKKHGTPIKSGVSATGNAVVVIGRESLDATDLDETVTVVNTGHVPAYTSLVSRTRGALTRAGIDFATFEEAVNKRDVSHLDDAARNGALQQAV